MTTETVEAAARELGFRTAWIRPEEIPVNPGFRKYCEENRCGHYDANYACPPDCGTPEEMARRLHTARRALVLQSQWDIPDYGTPEVLQAKAGHSGAVCRLRDLLREQGETVLAAGYGSCERCRPCRRKLGEPCPFPGERISCLSAYCVDVAKLAEACGLPFDWDPKRLYLFGMILFP